WSLQLHSRLMDRWNPANEKWLGTLPTLGDDGEGGRIVRSALGISQIIITPKDITIAEPQPNDSPWAGMLGLTSTWSSYDNRRLGALQLYLGCLGPCSQAERVQTFVHRDPGLADTPRGWKNQLSNKALVNLNYEYRRKLLAPEAAAYAPGRFATDLSLGGSGAAGNLTTRLTGEVELRFGWGLPMGFTKIPDPPGLGMMLDPIYIDAREPSEGWDRWRLFFTVVARLHEINYLAGAEERADREWRGVPSLQFVPWSQGGARRAALRPLAVQPASHVLPLSRVGASFRLPFDSGLGELLPRIPLLTGAVL